MEERLVANGRELVITGENAASIARSPKFLRWLKTLQADLNIEEINELWSWWSREGELIFALIRVQHIDEMGKRRGRIVFFRSDAVAVWLVIRDQKTMREFVALVEQARVPTGGKILEIPAGSVEDDGKLAATMAREIGEEVGLQVAKQDLACLGTYYFSPGTCNEKITLFSCEIELYPEEIQRFQDRFTGLHEHGENIRVRIVALEDFEKLEIRDAKTRLAYELYRRRKAKGRIRV